MKLRLATFLLASAGLFGPALAQDDPPTAGSDAMMAAPAAQANAPASAPLDATPAPAVTPVTPVSAPAPANQQAALEPEKTIDASTAAHPDDSDGIAATVNDESISEYELRQRINLFIATSGLHPNAADMKRIHDQSLDKLEDEKIQLQAAVKKHVTVSPVEVDKAINGLLDQNKLTLQQLRNILIQAGAS